MAEIKLYATNILWDVQDDDTLSKEALMLLPTLTEIPKEKFSLTEDRLKAAKESHEKMTELINDINDDVVDYLSDTYGFMIESLNYEISDTGFIMDELAKTDTGVTNLYFAMPLTEFAATGIFSNADLKNAVQGELHIEIPTDKLHSDNACDAVTCVEVSSTVYSIDDNSFTDTDYRPYELPADILEALIRLSAENTSPADNSDNISGLERILALCGAKIPFDHRGNLTSDGYYAEDKLLKIIDELNKIGAISETRDHVENYLDGIIHLGF